MKQDVRVTTYVLHDVEANKPYNLKELLSIWQSDIEDVPEELRDSMEVILECSSYANVDIALTYMRPETDEEMKRREAGNKRSAAYVNKRKLTQYNKLKKELGL